MSQSTIRSAIAHFRTSNHSWIFHLLILTIFSSSLLRTQTPCVGGMALGFPCHNVDLMAHIPLNSFIGATSANDIWGWTDQQTGHEYAILGLSNGTAFVDITNPVNPILLGTLPTATFSSSWRDIKVNGDFAFIVSEAGGHGVQSFDLGSLRNVVSPPVTFSALDHLTNLGTGSSHNIVALNEAGYMIVVGASTCSGGLTFVNVQDPANMIVEGCFSADGYTHDAVCFVYHGPDSEHIGKQICIASNTDTQTFIDVTDKDNPISLARIPYDSEYTHQGWVTPDHRYLIFGDELDEARDGVPTRTFIMDITDLDNPSDPIYYDATTAAIDHNQYIQGRFSYQANYRAGFRMIDLKNISNASLNEVAFFDIYPANDNGNFNGAWGVFPYFKSGLVIISGIEQGLFIVKPNIPHIVLEGNLLPVQADCNDQDIIFDIDLTSYGSYSEQISLSATDLPSGAIATFSVNPVTPDGTSTLTLHHPNGFSGAHSLNIQARSQTGDTLQEMTVAYEINETLYVDDPFLYMFGKSGHYQANDRIVGSALIQASHNVRLTAGEEIRLDPNFTVAQGAVFEAAIEWCGSGQGKTLTEVPDNATSTKK